MRLPFRLRRARPVEAGRLEAFSDGVFAVAITLLALDLMRIHADPRIGDGTLWAALSRLWPTLLAFAAAFAFVGVAWTNHHNVFIRVARVSRAVNAANLLLLAGIALVPWATATLAAALSETSGSGARQEIVLYAAVTTFGALTWGLLFHMLAQDPSILREAKHAASFSADRYGALIGIAGNGIAVVVALAWSSQLATLVLLALPVFFAVASEGFERSTTATGNTPGSGPKPVRVARSEMLKWSTIRTTAPSHERDGQNGDEPPGKRFQ